MATVIGESGAWYNIAIKLQRCGLDVHRPNDIEPKWNRLRTSYQNSVERIRSEIAHGISNKESQIAGFRSEKKFLRSFINWFRIIGCRMAIDRMRREGHRYIDKLTENINRVEQLLTSGDFSGAIAELDVISHLSRLSSEYIVFNNIYLTTDRYIHFNGNPIQSAQIDHIVLSPAGVFVIETKRWSQRFVESGHYHDPFDQIQRSSYLCYDQLRIKFGKIRVRSVIACAGNLPEPPKNSYVKILPVSELVRYISWFRQTEIPQGRLLEVKNYLQKFVSN